jgi:MFS transporter, SHS family, lactate transporter
MLRFVGGIIFGTAADMFGRKWPLVCNLFLIIVLEICTGFCATFSQFLAVRAMFGIAMGGIYGNAAATALEDCPEEARGLLSGIYQSGYNTGYLLAVVFWKAFSGTKFGWRSLFWLSAGLPVLLIIVRIYLPETKAYRERVDNRNENHRINNIVSEAKIAVRRYWLLLLYLVLLLTGFSYMVSISLLKTQESHVLTPSIVPWITRRLCADVAIQIQLPK